jgi:hypothetical protein
LKGRAGSAAAERAGSYKHQTTWEAEMSPERGPERPGEEAVPLGQRLYDRPFLLLIAGIIVMVVFYTGWGLFEIATLTPAPLP